MYKLITIIFISSIFIQNAFATEKKYSSPYVLGNGQVSTFVKYNKNKPIEIGVEITEAAFYGLPTTESDGKWDVVDRQGNVIMPCCGHEIVMSYPKWVLENTNFKHFVLNWNPQGHVPAGIYDIPHFDFHFYTISNYQRQNIKVAKAENRCFVVDHFVPVTCDIYYRSVKALPAKAFPARHSNVGAVEPGMGNHLLDLSYPEFNNGIFTHTWIFGTFDGEMILYEPMITKAYLESLTGKVCVNYVAANRNTSKGWYPT